MVAINDISQERQRVADRLARLDSERDKLAEELAELEAAERVLARLGHGGSARRRRLSSTEAMKPAAQRRTRQPPIMRSISEKTSGLSLGDATLRAITALGNGASAEDVRTYLDRHFGMQVRPNHLGMALQRHRRAGRLEQRDARWWWPHSSEPEAAAAE